MSSSSLRFTWTQCDAEKFVRRLSEWNNEEMALEKLDQLTPDEARMTAGQILEIVYGLVEKTRVVMDGEQMDLAFHPLSIELSYL